MAMSRTHQQESVHNKNSSLFTIEEIDERIQQLLAENVELRNTLQQNNTYMRLLINALNDWQNEVDRIHGTYHNKFDTAKEIISNLKLENAILKQKYEPINGLAAQESFFPHTPNQDFREVLDDYLLVDHEPYSITATTLGLHSSDLEQKQKLFNGNLSCNGLDHQQKSLNTGNYEVPRLLAGADKQIEKSSSISQNNKTIHGDCKIQELEKTNKILNQQNRELSEKINSLNARLSVAEELVLSKQTQNTELLMEVARLEKAVEVIPVLNAQLELYQSDFEAEREARQCLAGEKDALAQELRIIKRKIDALQVNAATPSSPNACEIEAPQSYECPKCNFKYSTFESLNNHLDECLNQQMFPV